MAPLMKSALDGKVETLILGLLEAGPSYGYQLIQDLNASAAGLLELGEGTVYPVLHRMERRGLVAPNWREAESGRKRKYYRLSPRGRKALAHGRAEWQSLVTVMEAVLGKGKGSDNDSNNSRNGGLNTTNALPEGGIA